MRVIAIAMHDEAKYLIPNKESITFIDEDTIVLLTGIGKVNAAMALTHVINHYDVDEVVNIGVAGATEPFNVNDIVIIKEAKYHDADATAFGYKKYQIPGMPEYYESNQQLMERWINKVDYPFATLYTGDEFVVKNKGFQGVIDMEATALYQVCYAYEIPIISIKIISDIIEHQKNNYESFDLDQAAKKIAEVIHQFLEDVR